VEDTVPNKCPDCGATLQENTTCQTIFDSLLILEFSNPDYGKVHFLTVACFMIQHRRYSDDAYHWIEQKLRANLDEGIPADQIRRQAVKETDQRNRTWKVTRRTNDPPLPLIDWSMTIADVATNYQDARGYQDLVKQWARMTLLEMKPYLVMHKE
jgi:Family of unknown function (DUF5946)